MERETALLRGYVTALLVIMVTVGCGEDENLQTSGERRR
jgi:hypothetical protein